MLNLKLQYFYHLMWRADSLGKTLMLGKTEGKRRRGWQRMKWIATQTQWTWIWAKYRRQWRIEEPGGLQYMGSQRVKHDLVTKQQHWSIIGLHCCVPCLFSYGNIVETYPLIQFTRAQHSIVSYGHWRSMSYRSLEPITVTKPYHLKEDSLQSKLEALLPALCLYLPLTCLRCPCPLARGVSFLPVSSHSLSWSLKCPFS